MNMRWGERKMEKITEIKYSIITQTFIHIEIDSTPHKGICYYSKKRDQWIRSDFDSIIHGGIVKHSIDEVSYNMPKIVLNWDGIKGRRSAP